MKTNINVNTNGAIELALNQKKMAKAKPVIVSQSRNVHTQSGNPHELQVRAKGKNLSFQWQVDSGLGWSNIAREGDAATYVSKPKGMHNSPETYRCVVSNAAGSALSLLISTTMIQSSDDRQRAKAAKAVEDIAWNAKTPDLEGILDDISDSGALEATLQEGIEEAKEEGKKKKVDEQAPEKVSGVASKDAKPSKVKSKRPPSRK